MHRGKLAMRVMWLCLGIEWAIDAALCSGDSFQNITASIHRAASIDGYGGGQVHARPDGECGRKPLCAAENGLTFTAGTATKLLPVLGRPRLEQIVVAL